MGPPQVWHLLGQQTLLDCSPATHLPSTLHPMAMTHIYIKWFWSDTLVRITPYIYIIYIYILCVYVGIGIDIDIDIDTDIDSDIDIDIDRHRHRDRDRER